MKKFWSMKKMIRIKDIAEMAQVSMGTVDRVIHDRGKVSASAKEKVMKVLEKIDYKPNLIAKTLSSAKIYKIAALLPDPTLDAYWMKPVHGIQKAESEFSQFGIEMDIFVFDPYISASFNQQAEKAIQSKPDGILLAPILRREALDLSNVCQNCQIPLVCFNTHIDELNSLSFIGQDLHQSGRLAAEMMSMGSISGQILIIHIGEKAQNSVHLYEKEQGFREFMEQTSPHHFEVITVELESPAGKSFERDLERILKEYHHTSGIFVTTSKAFDVARFLEKKGRNNLRLIGYDLIEENLPYLQRGTIDILIHQKAEKQSFLGISYLTDYLVFKKAIPKNKHLPLSIITRENLDSYLQADLD